jgi:putative ABC transport system permease protein
MKNSAPGFKKDHMLVIDFQFDGRVAKHSELIKRQFAGITNSDVISMSSCVPGKVNHIFPTMIENRNADLQEFQMDSYFIDHDFLKQYEIPLAAGRTFSVNLSSDSTEAMLINESASTALGFSSPEQALGKKFQQLNRKGVIIGVTKDFHFHSFQEKVRPLSFRIAPGFFTCLTVNVPAENLSRVVEDLRKEWQGIIPGMPFIYSFADDAYYQQYVAEERFGKLFYRFAALAIILSCLGLLGLTTLSITRRTKEIGIRKVLGASVSEVVRLISADFVALILISMLIAIPVAWYFMDQWLHGFAYRIDVAFWMFAASGAMALLIALITTAWQTIKAALMNPVQSLKSD